MLARSWAHSTPRWHPSANLTLSKHLLVHSEIVEVSRLRREGPQASARTADGSHVPEELPDGTLVFSFGDSSNTRSNRSQKQRSRASELADNAVPEPAAERGTAPNENGANHAALQSVSEQDGVAASKVAERAGDDEVPATNESNAGLEDCTVKQLTQLCKEKGFKGYSGLNKAGLVELLGRGHVESVEAALESLPQSEADDTDCSDLDEDFDLENADLGTLTVKQLRSVCKQRGMRGYSGLRKHALIGFLLNERK